MPRFFFHTADGGEQRDPDGTVCEDACAARREAIRYAGAVLHDDWNVLRDGREFRVEMTDEREQLLFTVTVKAVDAAAGGQAAGT